MSELIACTVITKSYLAFARTLALTLSEHNPGSTLYVLLADRLDDYFDPEEEPFKLIQLEELDHLALIQQMSFYYTPFEFCCALRGMLHDYMLKRTTAQKWLFLDSDIMICYSLSSIMRQLDTCSILLNPHCVASVPVKYAETLEINLLRSGLYNAGFLGLRRSEETTAFISWFKDRLPYFSFEDRPHGQYVDQLWLNFVPLFFKDIAFLSDPGANLAYWNLYERTLEEDAQGHIIVNGKPLLFFHFSGWDISTPQTLTKYPTVYDKKVSPILSKLGEQYREMLLANGHTTTKHYPYAFNHFKNGEPIAPDVRRKYFKDLVQGKAFEISPFENYLYFYPPPNEPEGIKPLLWRMGVSILKWVTPYALYQSLRGLYYKQPAGTTLNNKPPILIVTNHLPWPLESGSLRRLFYLIEGLQRRGYTVDLFHQDVGFKLLGSRNAHDIPATDPLQKLCREIRTIPQPLDKRLKEGLRVIKKRVRNGISQLLRKSGLREKLLPFRSPGTQPRSTPTSTPVVFDPAWNATNRVFGAPYYYPPDLQRAVQKWLRKNPDGMIWAHYMYCLPALLAIKAKRPFPLILDSIDVLYLLEKRSLLQQGISEEQMKSYIESLRQEEARRLASCDLVITVSDRDKAHFESLCRSVPYVTLPIDVTCSEYVEPSSTGKVPEIIFLGYATNFGNMDGIRWFVKECWPDILSKFPEAKLKITGDSVRYKRELGEQPGLELIGFVPDLEALYQSATLVIAPITAGSGVKVKVLEAMAHGRAAVVSVIAAEGLEEAVAAGAIVVARDREGFIKEVCRLLEDVPARHQIESRGRSWMKRHYQPAIAEAYERIFKCLERKQE